jgi:mgtE-like transporter
MAMGEDPLGTLLSSVESRLFSVATPEKDDDNSISSFGNLRQIVKHSFFALFICASADIFAGISLAKMAYILSLYPGLVVLIPGIMGMRGSIFGSFVARLGTGLHTGEVSPPFKSSEPLLQQIRGVAAQTLAISLVLALAVKGFGFVAGLEMMSLQRLIVISALSGILSGALLLAFVLVVILKSFRAGIDPDNISVPLITATCDVITIPILFASAVAVSALSESLTLFFSLGLIVLTSVAAAYSLYAGSPHLARIFRQSFPVLVICSAVSTVAGTFMGLEIDMLVAWTAMLLLIPVFNAEGGNLGGILSSRLSSAYHLGITKMGKRPDELTEKNFSSILLLSLLIFPVLGIFAQIVSMAFGFSSPGFWKVLLICAVAGFSITAFTITITYYLTYFTVKIGIDPDNVVVPIITSIIDVLGTGTLILVTVLMI